METDVEVLARTLRRMMGPFCQEGHQEFQPGSIRFEMPVKHLPVEDFMHPAWVRHPLQAQRAPSMPPSPPDCDSTSLWQT